MLLAVGPPIELADAIAAAVSEAHAKCYNLDLETFSRSTVDIS